ncbi:hypothetical protein L3Q82_004065 [Scortum barcoo]|uniref:Uncharacterized protein n=1 Tax=Scortum barcoo TaxID=214431 RepID=A0ACB8X7S0_9TELE|nr:hypothetical protein L3Q82_004065 [Scortum barcoo]
MYHYTTEDKMDVRWAISVFLIVSATSDLDKSLFCKLSLKLFYHGSYKFLNLLRKSINNCCTHNCCTCDHCTYDYCTYNCGTYDCCSYNCGTNDYYIYDSYSCFPKTIRFLQVHGSGVIQQQLQLQQLPAPTTTSAGTNNNNYNNNSTTSAAPTTTTTAAPITNNDCSTNNNDCSSTNNNYSTNNNDCGTNNSDGSTNDYYIYDCRTHKSKSIFQIPSRHIYRGKESDLLNPSSQAFLNRASMITRELTPVFQRQFASFKFMEVVSFSFKWSKPQSQSHHCILGCLKLGREA